MNSERRKGYYSAGEDIAITTEQTQLLFFWWVHAASKFKILRSQPCLERKTFFQNNKNRFREKKKTRHECFTSRTQKLRRLNTNATFGRF